LRRLFPAAYLESPAESRCRRQSETASPRSRLQGLIAEQHAGHCCNNAMTVQRKLAVGNGTNVSQPLLQALETPSIGARAGRR